MATLSSNLTTKEKEDIEAQQPLRPGAQSPLPSPGLDTEYQVSGWTKISYLAVYFLCNISLTIYNKLILGKVRSCFLSLGYLHAGSLSLTLSFLPIHLDHKTKHKV